MFAGDWSHCSHSVHGIAIWTAGQRLRGKFGNKFVWKIMDRPVYPMSYENWRRGEPNNVNDRVQCVFMWENVFYKWNDVSCHNKYCFVCERRT